MATPEQVKPPGNNTVGLKEHDLPSEQPEAMHRNVQIGYSEEIVGFAPFHRAHKCQSRAGRWRSRHTYVGGQCIFCDCLARGDWFLTWR